MAEQAVVAEQERPGRVLFVCTANQVRSAFAEGVARNIAARSGLQLSFASAGTEATRGASAVVSMVEVACKAGIDLTQHRARQVTAEHLLEADVVVTMTGEHALDVMAIEQSVVDRTLTLRELAVAASQTHPLPESPTAIRSWLVPVVDRPISELLGGDYDVIDPIGGPKRAYRKTAAEITDLVETALGLVRI